MTWPSDITGFIAKAFLHAIYAIGSFLSNCISWIFQQGAHQIEASISQIITTSGIMTLTQQQQLTATTANIGIVANFLSGCICNQTIFWQGIDAVLLAACAAMILRTILKLWAIIWSGQ